MKIRSLAIASLFVMTAAHATLVQEKFATDPALAGWQIFGDTNFFRWNAAGHNLAVTWDSTQTNSYFYHPLSATVTPADSFCVQFDLQLTNAIASGYGAELAIGLLNLSDATSASFSRANSPSPNLFEFDYFPDVDFMGQSYPASLDATLKDAQPGYAGFYFAYDNLPLDPSVTYRVVLVHTAGQAGISGTVYTNGQVFTDLPKVSDYGAGGFRLDTLSISSYADDGFGDSILAHGTVANLAFASPLPIGQVTALAAGKIQFASDTNWIYHLDQSGDFKTWTPAAPAAFGNGTNLVLTATNAPSTPVFYRVRAELP